MTVRELMNWEADWQAARYTWKVFSVLTKMNQGVYGPEMQELYSVGLASVVVVSLLSFGFLAVLLSV